MGWDRITVLGALTLSLLAAMLIGFCAGYSFRSWRLHRAQRRARVRSLYFAGTMTSMVGELTPPRSGERLRLEPAPPSIPGPPIVPHEPGAEPDLADPRPVAGGSPAVARGKAGTRKN